MKNFMKRFEDIDIFAVTAVISLIAGCVCLIIAFVLCYNEIGAFAYLKNSFWLLMDINPSAFAKVIALGIAGFACFTVTGICIKKTRTV